MNILLAIGVTILAATAPPQPQPAGLGSPLTVTFVKNVSIEEVVSTFSKMSGITMEFDFSVTEEMRKLPAFPNVPVTLRNVTLEQAIDLMTRDKGLAYIVLDPKVLRIYRKA